MVGGMIKMDDYVKDKINQVKELLKIQSSEFDDDLEAVFNKVYEDGFQDGQNEGDQNGTKETVC